MSSGHFAVHVLASKQETLSNLFAQSGRDKFAEASWSSGILGSPLLDEYAARFQCKTMYQHEGGDHLIFVGEVVDFQTTEKSPLIFHAGAYADAKPKSKIDSVEAANEIDHVSGQFSESFFPSLLARADFQFSHPLKLRLVQNGIDQGQFLFLSIIGMNEGLAKDDLLARAANAGLGADVDSLSALERKGMIVIDDSADVTLSDTGRQTYIDSLVFIKATERSVFAAFTESEEADFRYLLKKFVEVSAAHAPAIYWNTEQH